MDCGPILIVDTDRELRSGLSELLGRRGFECIQASSGEEAVALAGLERPWLVLLDLRLPDISGYEVCRELRDEFGDELAIIFLSADRTEPMDRAAGLLVGADDYVVKPFDSGELLARVRRLSKRASAKADKLTDARQESTLTPREFEVLTLLAQGRRPQAIADSLIISEKTVSSHVQRVLAKLGVNSRAQAVAVAYRDGLIDATAMNTAATTSSRERRMNTPLATVA